jgi:hypothetical protein
MHLFMLGVCCLLAHTRSQRIMLHIHLLAIPAHRLSHENALKSKNKGLNVARHAHVNIFAILYSHSNEDRIEAKRIGQLKHFLLLILKL